MPYPAYCVVNKITLMLPFLKSFKTFIICAVLPFNSAKVIPFDTNNFMILVNTSTLLNTINFPSGLFLIISNKVSSLLRIPFPILLILSSTGTISLVISFLILATALTIAVIFSGLLISARQSGHFLLTELLVFEFRNLKRQPPQNIWVHSNIIGCVTLSKHIEHILLLISVIRSVKSLIFPSIITISLSIVFKRFALVSSAISRPNIYSRSFCLFDRFLFISAQINSAIPSSVSFLPPKSLIAPEISLALILSKIALLIYFLIIFKYLDILQR